jgi:hypothetical protein
MTKLMKSLFVGVVFLASSAAFASPLSETVTIDGGTSALTHHAFNPDDFTSADQSVLSPPLADSSTRNSILMLGESGQRSIAGQLRSTPTPTPTPEPATLVLMGTGLAGAAALVLRRRRSLQ